MKLVIFFTCTVLLAYTTFAQKAERPVWEDDPETQLTQQLFDEMQTTAKDFMAKYPPSEYYYLGLGRSPHSILSYIDALNLGGVKYIPMSNAKFHFQDNMFRNLRTPERETIVREHVARLLPSEADLRGRKILVVDFCDNASGLTVGLYYVIEAYFAMGFDLAKIRAVGLNKTNPTAGKYYRNLQKLESTIIHVDTYQTNMKSGHLYRAMMYGDSWDWLEYYAPVGRFDLHTLTKDESYSENRPEYQFLLDWIRQKAAANCAETLQAG